ncbi:MAG: DUF5103 domain-containing protein [Bacteroidia bacterium]|nr:DUF5103 domain-containing protein [Bacteroidia bacterium]
MKVENVTVRILRQGWSGLSELLSSAASFALERASSDSPLRRPNTRSELAELKKRLFEAPLILLFLFISVMSQSQNTTGDDDYVNSNVLKYDDYIYKANIRTIQFHESSWEYGAPVISLHGEEQLTLEFDDLDGDRKDYTITFVHCNADWTPSNLMTAEYMTGYYEFNILNFGYGMNTYQKFTHYEISFPQAGTQMNTLFTKSGNYLMYVYINGNREDLAFSRRFMVYDNKTAIAGTFRQQAGGGDQFSKQHIDFKIVGLGYDINNPYKDMKVVLVQNNRWDNAITDIKPTFLNNNEFTYSLDDASTFTGGNEFRYFDTRSMRFLTERVKDIYKDNDLKYHVTLYNDEVRASKPYLFYNDFNGAYLIKNREALNNTNVEADYVYVDFFLSYPKPEAKGNFYIMGKLTDWRMNKLSKMTYNYDRGGYQTRLYLKQGFYNYMYVLSNDTKPGGDETITEGSFWDTENDYYIYVYHRQFGTYYDQLIGMKRLNSLKR